MKKITNVDINDELDDTIEDDMKLDKAEIRQRVKEYQDEDGDTEEYSEQIEGEQ